MLRAYVRRLSALLLALALALGPGSYGMAAPDMATKMTTAAAGDMPMHDGCNGCLGNDRGMAATACFTFCSGAVAVLPWVSAVGAVDTMVPLALPVVPIAGRQSPPDPPPPRPAVLN
jgi:hypothetical protein